jgi:hypothetical protein
VRADGEPMEEPEVAPLDQEAEQRELEEAGWERVYRQGKLLWRHPESGSLYPQGPAVRRLWTDLRGEEGPADSEPRGGT